MPVFRIIQQLDHELKGEINLEVYEKRLQGFMDGSQIERSLFLFLVLLRIQNEVNQVQAS